MWTHSARVFNNSSGAGDCFVESKPGTEVDDVTTLTAHLNYITSQADGSPPCFNGDIAI